MPLTTKVQGLKIGDFLKMEAAGRYSRDLFTVLSGQVLKRGQVCTTDTAGKKKAITGTGNEAHTYTPNSNATSGTYFFRLWHYLGYWVQTAPLAYNASTGTIQTAINAVLGTNAVGVTGSALSAGNPILTFSGTNYAGLSFPLGQIEVGLLGGTSSVAVTRSTSAGVAKNEVQTVLFPTLATGGNLKIGVAKPVAGEPYTAWPFQISDLISWCGTVTTMVSNIQTALDDVCGQANSIVAGGTNTNSNFTLTFNGTGFAATSHPLVMIDTSNLTSVTSAVVSRTTPGGKAGDATTILNNADSICLEDTDASGGDVTLVPFLVRQAIVDPNMLYYGGADPAASLLGLKAAGILAEAEGAITPGV